MPITPPGSLKSIVFMDFENIQEFLHQYDTDSFAIQFFPTIFTNFQKNRFKILDFMIYGNFEKESAGAKHQTYLRSLGLQTRHSSYQGKSSSDLELAVDALISLFKTPGVDLFILITNGRDMIPLLRTIRLEAKLSCILTSRNGFNKIVAEYADYHDYLEDLFGLGDPAPPIDEVSMDEALQQDLSIHKDGLAPLNQASLKIKPVFDRDTLEKADIERAREVARLFYSSHIWRRSVMLNEPVTLLGYTRVIAKAVSRLSADILNDFKIAHVLKFITIYQGPNQRLFIKEGAKKEECV